VIQTTKKGGKGNKVGRNDENKKPRRDQKKKTLHWREPYTRTRREGKYSSLLKEGKAKGRCSPEKKEKGRIPVCAAGATFRGTQNMTSPSDKGDREKKRGTATELLGGGEKGNKNIFHKTR